MFRSQITSSPSLSPDFSSVATLHSSLCTILFRITLFAHPHYLTPIESHLCKKRGRGWSIPQTHSAQPIPLFSTASKHPKRSNARNSIFFMRLLHGSLDTRGWGASALFRVLQFRAKPPTKGFCPVGKVPDLSEGICYFHVSRLPCAAPRTQIAWNKCPRSHVFTGAEVMSMRKFTMWLAAAVLIDGNPDGARPAQRRRRHHSRRLVGQIQSAEPAPDASISRSSAPPAGAITAPGATRTKSPTSSASTPTSPPRKIPPSTSSCAATPES